MIDWLTERVPSFPATYREVGSKIRRSILQSRPQMRFDMNRIRHSVLQQTLQQCDLDSVSANELATSALAIFHGRRNRFRYIDHAEDMLASISSLYKLVSVTNGTAEVNQSRLGKYFDHSLSAHNVSAMKPNPTMFVVALSHFGTQPQEAVHVGDHPVDDIECASKIGMHTIQFHTESRARKREVSPVATRVVHDLREVPSALEEIGRL